MTFWTSGMTGLTPCYIYLYFFALQIARYCYRLLLLRIVTVLSCRHWCSVTDWHYRQLCCHISQADVTCCYCLLLHAVTVLLQAVVPDVWLTARTVPQENVDNHQERHWAVCRCVSAGRCT